MTQAQKILNALQNPDTIPSEYKKGEWISTRYFKIGLWITETNGRISELRNKGFDVETHEERDPYGFAYHRLKVSQPSLL